MPALKNFVAVDWRAGKDRIYFFFKDTNQYSRFDLGDNKVAEGHPKEIKASNWGDFHLHAKNLRFGFTTTGFPSILSPLDFTIGEIDLDIAWLFIMRVTLQWSADTIRTTTKSVACTV